VLADGAQDEEADGGHADDPFLSNQV